MTDLSLLSFITWQEGSLMQPVVAQSGEQQARKARFSPLTGIVHLMGVVGSWLFVAVAFVVAIEVVMRSIFHLPQIWTGEIAGIMTVVGAFLVFAYTLQEKGHTRVDFISVHLSRRANFILDVFNDILSLGFCTVLLWTGAVMIRSSRVMEQGTSVLDLPVWIFQLSVPVSALFMALILLRNLGSSVRAAGTMGERRGFKDYLAMLIFLASFVAGALLLKVSTPIGLLVLFVALLFNGMPVAYAMGLFGIVGLYLFLGRFTGLMNVPMTAYNSIDSQVVIAFPLFFLSGSILSAGKLGPRIFSFTNSLVRHLPGGIGIASIIFCGIFAAMTGSSVAVAAAISAIALPEMLQRGYSRKTSIGLLAAGGTLGILFPPSVGLIFYSALTGESIGKLFIAAVIPGVLLCIMFILYVAWVGMHDKGIRRDKRASVKEIFLHGKDALGGLIVILIIMGGIYSGLFTVTEAGAVAVLYSIFLTVFWYKTMTFSDLFATVLKAGKMAGMLNLIIISANIAAILITMSHVTQDILTWINAFALPNLVYISAIAIFLIILGGPLEAVSITVICVPILYPIVTALGFSGIWFGVFVTVLAEFAIISPPEGMNLFVLQEMSKGTSAEVSRAVLPFLGVMLVFILLIIFFPALATWLPSVLQ
jgi:C4-dicarboxylate transporter, DctM subunit